jgi:drug/metabolite transporter (DMT)-like permease
VQLLTAIIVCMERKNQTAIAALATAGMLWGLTVPLSKLALGWLGPAWLTVMRFALCAPVLAVVARRTLRPAISVRVVLAGAIGFGGVILLQNAGIERTSVSHAAVVVGAVPLLVALITAALGRGRVRAHAWGGFVLALGGIALVAGAGGGGSTLAGDLLVLASAALSATFIVAQSRVLDGRDATAVTAVQFTAGAVVSLPVALLTEGAPRGPLSGGPVLAFVALSVAGTLMSFWLFAFGQTRVQPQLAGAFVNLEPVVGAALGWLAFGNAATIEQLGGAVAVLAGIALSTMPATRLALSETPVTPRRRAETRPRGCSESRRPSGRRRALRAAGRPRRGAERRPPRAGARSRSIARLPSAGRPPRSPSRLHSTEESGRP